MGAYTQYDAGVTAVSNILDDIAKRQSDRLAKEMNEIINNQMKTLYAEEMKTYSADVNTKLSNIRLSLDTLDNNKNEILKRHQDGSAYTEDEKKQIQNIEATEAELKKEKADLFNAYYNNGFDFQTQDTKWVCTICGAKNPIGASVCTVCNGKKPDENHIMFDKASTDITNTVSKPDTVNLAFNNKADVRKFAIDMEKQGVKCVIIAEKMNHQYLVMVDNKNMPAVKKYSSDEHMSIHEFKDYDVTGISALATSGEVSHFYGRTIKSEFYTTTDAGKTIAKYNRNSKMVKNFLKGRFGQPSSFETRRRGWESLEDTVINHNRGQANKLADEHFKEALKEYDPRTHKFTGKYKTTDEVLTKINDKWGKPFGQDVFVNKKGDPIMYKMGEESRYRVTTNGTKLEAHKMTNLSLTSDSIISMRTRIMTEYADVLNIKAGKFGGMGHLDKNQLMALKKGMSIKENRLGIGGKMPSEEEIDFLLMTADEGKDHHRIKGAVGIMRTALRYSSTGNGIYQIEKVISRTQQIYKVTKAGKKLIYDNAKRRVQVVRLRNAMNNPDKAKKRADKMLAKKSKAKPKQVKKANRKVKKNKKRIARMEKRDRRRLALANTKIGKFGRNVSKVNRSVKRAVQRSPIGRMVKGITDFVDKIKKKVFKKIALILGVPILGAICIILICLLLSGILSAIASFFAADTPQETMIYHIYEDLDDAQQDWIEEGRDPDKLWDKREKLKYGSLEMYQSDCGSSYLSWTDYINSLSVVDVYDDDGVSTAFKAKMFLDADGNLWVNPFGDMEWMQADDINKEIEEYEEYGCEWDVIPYGTTAHNNNIKDILCMTEVRYEHNIKEGTFGQDFQDTKFVWNIKNILNDIGNFFQSIGDWFSGNTEDPDDYKQTRSYGTICSYALNLWSMSHQTSIELEVRVLKAVTEEELEAKYGRDADEVATPEFLWKNGKCPEVGGCMDADIFFIDDNGTLCLMKADGNLQQIYTATKDIEDSCAIPDFLQTEDGQNATDEQIFEWCKEQDDCWEQAPTPTPYHTPWTNTGGYSTTDGVITTPSVTPTPKIEYTINNGLVTKKTTKYEYQVASNQGSVPTSEPTPTQGTSPSQGTSAPTPTGVIITPSGTIIPTNMDTVVTHTEDLSDYRYWTEITDDDLYVSQGIDKTRYVLLQKGNMFRLISRDKWNEYLEQEKENNMPNACMGNPGSPVPCSTPTPIPTRKNEVYASRGSSTPTPTASNTNTPTPTATSAPTDTPTPTSTATPTPTPVTYYQLQTRTYVEEERYAHKCSFDNRDDGKGEHDGYYCGGHIVAKVHGIVYGISENYLETEEGDIAEAKNPDPDKNKGLIYNANYNGDYKWAVNYWVSPEGVWVDDGFDKGDKNDSYFLARLPDCDDIFDIDLSVRYGNGLFPIHQAQWYKYDGWTNTTINLAVMKYKADWVGMYGFDIPENFGISPLSRKDMDKIVAGLKGYYGEDKITEKREETVRLILSCVGHGQYDMKHHGHCYKYYDWCSSGKNCTKTDCSGFCSYILLEEGVISGAMDTGSLHDGQQRWYGNVKDATIVEPGDCIIKWGGQTSWEAQQTGGTGSHALMYIGCLNEEVELTNGWIIPAGIPLVVDCLQMGEQYDANCGNIYLRLAIDGSNDDYGETLQGIAMSFPSYLARSDNGGYEMYVRKIE